MSTHSETLQMMSNRYMNANQITRTVEKCPAPECWFDREGMWESNEKGKPVLKCGCGWKGSPRLLIVSIAAVRDIESNRDLRNNEG
ncbi:MAG: hypothetical protein GY940_48285 [bacterium]|nr:hypothetical protein [bacterium]